MNFDLVVTLDAVTGNMRWLLTGLALYGWEEREEGLVLRLPDYPTWTLEAARTLFPDQHVWHAPELLLKGEAAKSFLRLYHRAAQGQL